jgi:hypothetical protein
VTKQVLWWKEALTRALSFSLSSAEIALIKTSVKFTEENRVLSGIVERTVNGITATFNKLLTILTSLPIVMVVYVLLTIMGALTQRV